MPYDVVKSGSGYKVETVAGPHKGHQHSRKPLSKARAIAQERAINIHTHEGGGNGHYQRKYGRHIDNAS